MGSGTWDKATYHSTKSTRAASGVDDFAYTKHASSAHPNLDPKRINKKPFGKLESRDNPEHPESVAVLVNFDVTGSNRDRAVDAQLALPKLMDMLHETLPDAQVAFAANDDYKAVGTNGAVQISDFESDIRIDEHLRNIWLVGNGGGNNGESYDLILYAAARKTVIDCWEKRHKKGYLFIYADEPFMEAVDRHEVKQVFGDNLERNISIEDIIHEAREQYTVFVIWPSSSPYTQSKVQYQRLFSNDYVLELQHPNLICELIGGTVVAYEKYLKATGSTPGDLHKPSIALPASSDSLTTR